MTFGWINAVNSVAVIWLILINMVAVKRGIAGNMKSVHPTMNLLEQVGRYACIIFMIFPIVINKWEFGFPSVAEMFLWLGATVILLIVYSVLWIKKKSGGKAVLYGLAIVPAILFLINGILLRHWLLLAFSLLFGICHIQIVRENIVEKG